MIGVLLSNRKICALLKIKMEKVRTHISFKTGFTMIHKTNQNITIMNKAMAAEST